MVTSTLACDMKLTMKKKETQLTQSILGCVLMLFVIQATAAQAGTAPGDIRYSREGDVETESFPPSVFQHWVHRIQYRCDACHDSLFEMKQGSTPVTMDLMKEGKVCGTCHNGELAFGATLQNCNRCHVSPVE